MGTRLTPVSQGEALARLQLHRAERAVTAVMAALLGAQLGPEAEEEFGLRTADLLVKVDRLASMLLWPSGPGKHAAPQLPVSKQDTDAV
jgi:hypothetical protein